MNVYPRSYTKLEFLKFLEKGCVSEDIINKFLVLPEVVKRNGKKYDLYINSTWYSDGATYYNYELNYYSEELIEYLFNSKVFSDVEKSINFLMCELINNSYITKPKIAVK